MMKEVLDAFIGDEDSGRWTSQEIADNLSETMPVDPRTVTEYMLEHGWLLRRADDRLVWVKR